MVIQRNPFFYGGVIKERHLFINRQLEVIEIYEAILASASVSVIGERRVGKSSLLRYLADPEVAQQYGLDSRQYLFAYFEFLGFPSITPSSLWRRLLTEILRQLRDPRLAKKVQALLTEETYDLEELQRLLKAFQKAGLNLVILFDEFDTAAANPNFDQAFFGGLRNLSSYRLSYIVASHRTLSDLRYAHPDSLVSPFFNIFRRITLRGFAPPEIEELLTKALDGTGIKFTQPDRILLDQLASSHPFFLQMAAYYLFYAYHYHYRRDQRPQNPWIERRFRDNAQEHFRYYWDSSEAGEKLILASLSLLEREEVERYQLYPKSNDPMYRRLEDRVLVVEDQEGKPRVFSSIFEEWIAETVSFVPIEQVEDLAWFTSAKILVDNYPGTFETIRDSGFGVRGSGFGKRFLAFVFTSYEYVLL